MALTELKYQALQRRLNHRFKTRTFLTQALTHRSKSKKNNERMEFLGDSLLGFVVSHMLFNRFPGADEGKLSRMRASLVKKETLAMIASELSLDEYVQLSPAESRSGGNYRDSTLADAFEAIVAAIYFDAGFTSAEAFVINIYEDRITDIDPDVSLKDPKSRLQELMQEHNQALPEYELTDTQGPPHEQIFTVVCRVNVFERVFKAKGKSRREAEQTAASETYRYAIRHYKAAEEDEISEPAPAGTKRSKKASLKKQPSDKTSVKQSQVKKTSVKKPFVKQPVLKKDNPVSVQKKTSKRQSVNAGKRK